MATRHSDRFSPPPPRRNSPSNLSSSSFQSRGKAPPPQSWDRYSRDRSFPRYYSTYDELDTEQVGSSSSYRQSYPPPRHHTPYSDHESGVNSQSNSYRPTQSSSSQRQNRKPAKSGSNAPSHRKTLSNSDLSGLHKTPDSNKTMPITRLVDPTKDQEEIFKKLLEVITDITQLKIDSTKAAMKLEATKQKYEKNTSHYAKFPLIKSTLQSEVDKAKQAVENIHEKMSRKDTIFQELAGLSLPILLPVLETCELRAKIPSREDSEIFKKLEKTIQKVELHCSELQQEFKRSLEEQSVYQAMKEKQYANLEDKLQEMISNDLGRRRENSELRSQLRSLSDEFSSLKKEMNTYRQEITTVQEAADFAAKDIVRVEKHVTQSEKEHQKKFGYIEARMEPISSIDTNLRTLLENGLLEVKASTIDSLSSTLKTFVTRLDSLPGASAYSSLHSRLANLENEQIPKSLSKQVSDLVSLDCDNRLKTLEIKAAAAENTVIPAPSVISAIQDQVQALRRHISANPSPSNSNEIANLRSLTECLQKSLNVVQINVASLHKRLPSKLDNVDEAKSSTSLMNDLNRRVAELTTIVDGSNHSLENLTARVDNISTGHLAQAILNQLSETYPHIQNFEHLALVQAEKIQGLQKNVDQFSGEISRIASEIQAQALVQSQHINYRTNTDRDFGGEIDKLSENIIKAYADIKKLAAAADDDRSYISEKLESRLGSLVDCADLKNHQLEMTNLLKGHIRNSLDEYNKQIIIPKFEKVESFSRAETSLERRLKDSFTETLREKNASSTSKLEEDLAAMKKELETQIFSVLQEQKKELEELVIAQVDRSLISSRSEPPKQIAKRVKTKSLANEEIVRSTRTSSRSDSPLATTPTNSVSNSAALTPSASATSRIACSSTIPTQNNNPQSNIVQPSTSSRNSSQQASSTKTQGTETYRKKRKLVNARSGSPRKTNGSDSPTTKRVRRTPNAGGGDKLPCRIPKTEKD